MSSFMWIILAIAIAVISWILFSKSKIKNKEIEKKFLEYTATLIIFDGEIKIDLYKLIKKGSFKEIFYSLGEDMDKFCFNDDTANLFKKNYRKFAEDFIKDEYISTFILYKEKDKFIVRAMTLSLFGERKGLPEKRDHFLNDYRHIWNEGNIVAIPQINTV